MLHSNVLAASMRKCACSVLLLAHTVPYPTTSPHWERWSQLHRLSSSLCISMVRLKLLLIAAFVINLAQTQSQRLMLPSSKKPSGAPSQKRSALTARAEAPSPPGRQVPIHLPQTLLGCSTRVRCVQVCRVMRELVLRGARRRSCRLTVQRQQPSFRNSRRAS